MNDIMAEMLAKMGRELGFEFDHTEIKNTGYFPKGFVELQGALAGIIRHGAAVLEGKENFGVAIKEVSAAPQPTRRSNRHAGSPPLDTAATCAVGRGHGMNEHIRRGNEAMFRNERDKAILEYYEALADPDELVQRIARNRLRELTPDLVFASSSSNLYHRPECAAKRAIYRNHLRHVQGLAGS